MMRATKMLMGVLLSAWGGGKATLLTVMVALTLATVTPAFGANGSNFILGSLSNAATATTRLQGNVASGPALQVINPNTAASARGLDVLVASGKPPIYVSPSAGKATNLNADKVDGQSFTCPTNTLFNEGVCIEKVGRAPNGIYNAEPDCLDERKRLPTVAELQTFRNLPGQDFTTPEWTSQPDFYGTIRGTIVVSSDGQTSWSQNTGSSGRYRCVVPPS